jgi:hypothetical protein
MKNHFAIGVVSFLVLIGCGGGSGSGSATYVLTSGTYRVSSFSATPPDNCNLGTDLQNATFQISVSGNNATFILHQSPNPNLDPVLTIQGNTLNAGSKTYDDDHNQDSTDAFDCVETITVTISGTVTGQNQIQGTVDQSSSRKSGMACALTSLGYKTFPCSSRVNFTATKV